SQRFKIDLPLEITQASGKRVNRTAHLSDISSGGISFTSNREWDVGGRIEFVITLSQAKKVRIRCLGKILRVQAISATSEARYKVAASIDRYEFVRAEGAEGAAT